MMCLVFWLIHSVLLMSQQCSARPIRDVCWLMNNPNHRSLKFTLYICFSLSQLRVSNKTWGIKPTITSSSITGRKRLYQRLTAASNKTNMRSERGVSQVGTLHWRFEPEYYHNVFVPSKLWDFINLCAESPVWFLCFDECFLTSSGY